MKNTDIQLETLNKLFEYEKHARVIDQMDENDLREFAKLYCKLYLRQQEVISSFNL